MHHKRERPTTRWLMPQPNWHRSIVCQNIKTQVEMDRPDILCPLRQPSYTRTSLAENPQMQTVPEPLARCTFLKIGQLQLDWSNLNVTTMQMTGFTKLKQACWDSHSCPTIACCIVVIRILICTLPQTTCVFPCISSACKLRSFSCLVKAQVQKTVVSARASVI